MKYTAFSILGEAYEFTRLPFGLVNAPLCFQRVIRRILSHLSFVIVYLDDILIFSEKEEDHNLHIKQAITALQGSGVSLNFEKTVIKREEIKYLGLLISSKGIKADTSRVDTYQDYTPKNRRGVMKLIGYINWFRPFIPNLSSKLLPLSDKLKTDSRFTWTEQDKITANAILQDIKGQTLLNYPDFSKPFYLETDLSDYALGSVLFQEGNILGFYSYKYNSVEIKYTILEKELLSILKSLQHFRNIVFNCKIIVRNDNRNILFHKEDISRRIQRWKLLLHEYNIKLEHIEGKQNICADFISRACSVSQKPQLLDLSAIATAQEKDISLQKEV